MSNHLTLQSDSNFTLGQALWPRNSFAYLEQGPLVIRFVRVSLVIWVIRVNERVGPFKNTNNPSNHVHKQT